MPPELVEHLAHAPPATFCLVPFCDWNSSRGSAQRLTLWKTDFSFSKIEDLKNRNARLRCQVQLFRESRNFSRAIFISFDDWRWWTAVSIKIKRDCGRKRSPLMGWVKNWRKAVLGKVGRGMRALFFRWIASELDLSSCYRNSDASRKRSGDNERKVKFSDFSQGD